MVIYDIKELSMVDFIPWIVPFVMLPGQLISAYILKRLGILNKVAFLYVILFIVLFCSTVFIRAVYKDHNLYTKNLKNYEKEYQHVVSTINGVSLYRGPGKGGGHKDQVFFDKESLIVYTTSRGGCLGGSAMYNIESKYKDVVLDIHYITVDEWKHSSCIVFIQKYEE